MTDRGPGLKGSCPKCGSREMRLEPEMMAFQVVVWLCVLALVWPVVQGPVVSQSLDYLLPQMLLLVVFWLVATPTLFYVTKRFHIWVCQGPAWNRSPRKLEKPPTEKKPPVEQWSPPWEKKRSDMVPAALVLLGVVGLFAWAIATGPGIWPDYLYEAMCPGNPGEIVVEGERFFGRSFVVTEDASGGLSGTIGPEDVREPHPRCLTDPRAAKWNVTVVARMQEPLTYPSFVVNAGYLRVVEVEQ